MAYKDYPIIDKNSERSEESVLSVRTLLTRKNGFISRDELPDNGVDLNVELISSGGATSHIFAIQIKSTTEVKIVKHDSIEYISIPFKTSRLGHLCRRPPAYGIVTIYDEKSKTTYYDFVEEIVNRLTIAHGNEEWKDQEEVNINIPLTVLSPESIAGLHQKMMIRFSDHGMLLQAFGELYHIPSLQDKPDNQAIDFNDPKQVEKLLKEQGLNLFNSKNFDMVQDLLGRLTTPTIVKSKALTLLAAITFGQVGMTIECDYYLQRVRLYSNSYTAEEQFLLDYTKLMVDFKKGDMTTSQFIEGLVTLRQKSTNSLNTLTLEINIIYSKFMGENEDRISETLLSSINEVFSKIDQSDLSETDKKLLKLFNLENLHNYGTGLYLRDAGKFKVQSKLGIAIPMSERLTRVKAILHVLNAATIQTHDILKESMESSNKIVTAFASFYKARFFFTTQFHTMMLKADEETKAEEKTTALYANTLNFCYQSVGMFIELSMWHEAHQSLCCAYDLQHLHRVLYGSDVGVRSIQEVEETMRSIEAQTGIRPYESIVESTYRDLFFREGSDKTWGSVPDDQVEKYARITLEAYGFPEERLVHIIADINAHKTFYRECTNTDLELLQDLTHTLRKETTYATAPIFIIRSKKTGIESKRSTDINEILDQFSTLLKPKGNGS